MKMEVFGVSLSEKIKNEEFENWIVKKQGRFRFVVYQGMKAMDAGIDSLELSVRAYNCLKRAGYNTVNEVISAIEHREDLMKVRNMGRKSADEVMFKLFIYNYENLKPEKRNAYIKRVMELN